MDAAAVWFREVVVEINKARRAFCIKHGEVPNCIACSNEFLDRFRMEFPGKDASHEVGVRHDHLLGMRIVRDDQVSQWELRE